MVTPTQNFDCFQRSIFAKRLPVFFVSAKNKGIVKPVSAEKAVGPRGFSILLGLCQWGQKRRQFSWGRENFEWICVYIHTRVRQWHPRLLKFLFVNNFMHFYTSEFNLSAFRFVLHFHFSWKVPCLFTQRNFYYKRLEFFKINTKMWNFLETILLWILILNYCLKPERWCFNKWAFSMLFRSGALLASCGIGGWEENYRCYCLSI